MLIRMEHNKTSVCVLHTLLFKKKHPSLIECIFFWNTKPHLVIVLHKLNNQALKREHKYLFISVRRIPLIRKKNNKSFCCCWLLLIILWRIINLSESIPYKSALTFDWEANMLWSLWWKLVLVKTVIITAILISVKCFFASLLCHNVASCEHSLKCYCATIKCHSHYLWMKYGLFSKARISHTLCFYTPMCPSSPTFKEKVTLESFIYKYH